VLTDLPTFVRWIVVVIVGLLAVVIYMHRSCIAPAATTIETEFGISSATMGDIQAAFSWGYLFQVLGGILTGRFGCRLTLSIFAVGTSLAVFGSSVSSSPDMLWWTTFWIGMMQAGIVPSLSQLMKDWMPATQRGISGAFVTGSMSIGATLASSLTGLLLVSTGWRIIFAAYGMLGLVWAAGFAIWFRNRPQDHPQVNQAEVELIQAGNTELPIGPATAATSLFARVQRDLIAALRVTVAMLCSWNQWMNCGQQFFRNFVYSFFITGFPAFLIKAFGVSEAEAGALNSIPLGTAIFGVFTGGILLDQILKRTGNRWLSRSGLAAGGHIISAACTLGAAWMPNATLAVLLIGIGIFFFGFGSPCTWAATMDIAGRNTSAFFAVMNTVGVVAGIYCPKIVGRMFDSASAGEISWDRIFFLFAAMNLAGGVCWLALRSSRPALLPAWASFLNEDTDENHPH
jgi:MFS family permease